VLRGERRVQADFREAQLQQAAVALHGERGVRAEVDHDPVKVGRLGQDDRLRAEVGPDLHRGRDAGAQEFRRLLDDQADLDGLLRVLLVTAEGQDLLDQVGGPPGTQQDGLQVTVDRRILGALAQGHLRVPEDGAQDVVEVVGDPARHGPDGLRLVGLCGVSLQFHLPGDVAPRRDLPDDPDGAVRHLPTTSNVRHEPSW
jgi:hypothetical protein